MAAADLFIRLNIILSSAIVILAFSLFAYMVVYNVNNAVGRSFAALLACRSITYVGDVALFLVENIPGATPWLKLQWIGIAFTPAAYLHFSDALQRMTNAPSLRRRVAVWIAYFFGFLLFLLAFRTNFLVHDPFYSPGITQFRAGPFFWVFTIYFYTTLGWGAYKILQARARCLTPGARRQMTYLAISFFAPALGVFPYMLIANASSLMPLEFLLIVLFLVNLGIAAMIIVMAYSVTFFGGLGPDRVIKHNLVHFLLRSTILATLIILVFLVLPQKEMLLGLSRDMILVTAIVAVIVLWQLFINLIKPTIDRLIFYQDRVEIAWISELDRRLLTTTDLQQVLENLLTNLCEILRVRTAFVYNLTARQGPRLESQIGSPEIIENAVTSINVSQLVEQKNGQGGHYFIIQNNFWFLVLRNKARDRYLGLLGLKARAATYDLTPDEEKTAQLLIEQMELALEDRRLQQEVFGALRSIIPEIDRVQRLRSTVRYTGSPSLATLANNPIHAQDFPQMVRDALSHYWGGPKLTHSPLLTLQVVQDALGDHESNPANALRSVLAQAIEKQRPAGERTMTATEWLMYNILELKFVQGLRVRDIAQRLAMSEADLYRKQRLAIEEVARTLSEMEAEEATKNAAATLEN